MKKAIELTVREGYPWHVADPDKVPTPKALEPLRKQLQAVLEVLLDRLPGGDLGEDGAAPDDVGAEVAILSACFEAACEEVGALEQLRDGLAAGAEFMGKEELGTAWCRLEQADWLLREFYPGRRDDEKTAEEVFGETAEEVKGAMESVEEARRWLGGAWAKEWKGGDESAPRTLRDLVRWSGALLAVTGENLSEDAKTEGTAAFHAVGAVREIYRQTLEGAKHDVSALERSAGGAKP